MFANASGSVSVAEFRRQGDPDWGLPVKLSFFPAESIEESK